MKREPEGWCHILSSVLNRSNNVCGVRAILPIDAPRPVGAFDLLIIDPNCGRHAGNFGKHDFRLWLERRRLEGKKYIFSCGAGLQTRQFIHGSGEPRPMKYYKRKAIFSELTAL
jgi:hypothetical protein